MSFRSVGTLKTLKITNHLFLEYPLPRRLCRFRQGKVFALLGLLSADSTDGRIPDELFPSYSKALEVIFKETARYLLLQGSLDILSGMEDISSRPDDLELPSWVPNFDVFQRATILGMPIHAIVVNFTAGGDVSHQNQPIWTDADPDIMFIDTYEVDEAQIFRKSLKSNDPARSGYGYLEGSAKLVDLFPFILPGKRYRRFLAYTNCQY